MCVCDLRFGHKIYHIQCGGWTCHARAAAHLHFWLYSSINFAVASPIKTQTHTGYINSIFFRLVARVRWLTCSKRECDWIIGIGCWNNRIHTNSFSFLPTAIWKWWRRSISQEKKNENIKYMLSESNGVGTDVLIVPCTWNAPTWVRIIANWQTELNINNHRRLLSLHAFAKIA